MTEFDSLIDPPRRRGRPTKEMVAAREAAKRDSVEDFYKTPEAQTLMRSAAAGNTVISEREFHMPVGQAFLAHIFNLDPGTVNRRLRRVKPAGYAGGDKSKRPLYDFKTACEHLLRPKMDVETFLATLNPAEMPNQVNKTFWEAKRIKLKFEIEAGQAWATGEVLETFGEVFMTIKNHTQLWVENMRAVGLSDEQQKKLGEMVDAYCADLHEKLIGMPAQRQTRSRLAAIEQEMLGMQDDEDGETDQ